MKAIITGIIISLLMPLALSQGICETCIVDDPAMCPPECLGGGEMFVPSCGNGICDPGEEGSCPEDCGGATSTTASTPEDQPQVTTTTSGEATATTLDNQAAVQTTTTSENAAAAPEVCGNNVCGAGENCMNCQGDYACSSGYECSDGSCIEKTKSKTPTFLFISLSFAVIIGVAIVLLKSKPKTL